MFVGIPDERRLEQEIVRKNTKISMIPKQDINHQSHSVENLNKISSFASLNCSMLFLPKPIINTSYINQETVAKVMQQQLLKKETLSDTTSISSSSTSSPLIHIRHRLQQQQQQQREDASSSGDSSVSSQRDSGLSSGINDESSDGSPRDSLIENEQTLIDSLIKQTERIMSK
jgi:hypothetical protein